MQFQRIDIHAHLNAADFEADRDTVAERALNAGTAFINVGTGLADSRLAVELADKYGQGVYAIVGLHPTETEDFDAGAFRKLCQNPKTVGIGECGLDYFHLDKDETIAARQKEKQHEIFLAQIALANETGKPLMLHIRDAYDDALEMLKSQAKVAGNSHFFAGSTEQAGKFLDLGFTVSFTGVITFAEQYAELVKYVPLDMMHAETDCPFVAPVPYRGKRNEPAYVSEVVAKIAQIKKLPLETVEIALRDNAKRLFGIDLTRANIVV